MSKITYAINLSIDGCCDHTKIGGNIDIFEQFEYFKNLLQDVDLIVYGRKTYEIMIPYWPDVLKDPSSTKEEIEYAQIFTAIDKIVFSKSLNNAEGNTRIERGNLEDEIKKLKQQSGKKIFIGGVSLPEQLIALGLVDEFYFVVFPVISGEGRRLLADTSLPEKLNLKLVESKTFKSGCVAFHYVKQ
jgi:dihydrofolate reductase